MLSKSMIPGAVGLLICFFVKLRKNVHLTHYDFPIKQIKNFFSLTIIIACMNNCNQSNCNTYLYCN